MLAATHGLTPLVIGQLEERLPTIPTVHFYPTVADQEAEEEQENPAQTVDASSHEAVPLTRTGGYTTRPIDYTPSPISPANPMIHRAINFPPSPIDPLLTNLPRTETSSSTGSRFVPGAIPSVRLEFTRTPIPSTPVVEEEIPVYPVHQQMILNTMEDMIKHSSQQAQSQPATCSVKETTGFGGFMTEREEKRFVPPSDMRARGTDISYTTVSVISTPLGDNVSSTTYTVDTVKILDRVVNVAATVIHELINGTTPVEEQMEYPLDTDERPISSSSFFNRPSTSRPVEASVEEIDEDGIAPQSNTRSITSGSSADLTIAAEQSRVPRHAPIPIKEPTASHRCRLHVSISRNGNISTRDYVYHPDEPIRTLVNQVRYEQQLEEVPVIYLNLGANTRRLNIDSGATLSSEQIPDMSALRVDIKDDC